MLAECMLDEYVSSEYKPDEGHANIILGSVERNDSFYGEEFDNILGAGETYKNNHEHPAKKDSVTSKLIPQYISECALGNNTPTCTSEKTVLLIGKSLGIITKSTTTRSKRDGAGDDTNNNTSDDTNNNTSDDTNNNTSDDTNNNKINTKKIMDEAKNQLHCETERCVLEKMSGQLGSDRVKQEIDLNLKVKGPTDSSLLSNIHIDTTLMQWSKRYPEFFAYNFNMRNYASYSYRKGYIVNQPDTLATINFTDLYEGTFNNHKYKCCGCVINTDTYQGAGKHWMALFADARGPVWSVEFFNSSGNAPAPEWVNWMEKTKNQMEVLQQKYISNDRGSNIPTVELVKVASIRHQQSKSECGLYSLFYIWARINKIPYKYFLETAIPDQLMFEFRHHLFEDPTRKTLKSFNWVDYTKTIKLEWE